jgi:adenine-specific DNA-methyltransferase
MADKQKQLGQYFTTNQELLENVFKLVKNGVGPILEPSFGQGHIINYFREQGNTRPFVGIELDDTLVKLEKIHESTTVHHCDFLTYKTDEKFSSIVGNPPYFKLKKNPNNNSILGVTNIYVAFIEKAYDMLAGDGELIFIIPSDFFKLTSAAKLKELLLKNGSFTDVFHPNKENLFKKATQDVMIFRYQKGVISNVTNLNNEQKHVILSQGNIYFDTISDKVIDEIKLDEVFDIKVGMVSGAEKIFANEEYSNISILTSGGYKNEILLTDLPEEGTNVHEYLQGHKQHLINRKIKKFSEKNWFQWGCLRNIKFMTEMQGNACLYAKVLTRHTDVFSTGTVEMYDGSLLCIYPKVQMTDVQIKNIKDFMNSQDFLKHFNYSGRYKVGQKTLSDCFIPRHLLEQA